MMRSCWTHLSSHFPFSFSSALMFSRVLSCLCLVPFHSFRPFLLPPPGDSFFCLCSLLLFLFFFLLPLRFVCSVCLCQGLLSMLVSLLALQVNGCRNDWDGDDDIIVMHSWHHISSHLISHHLIIAYPILSSYHAPSGPAIPAGIVTCSPG